MNWEAIGAVSEGLGALAVFITLTYLAIQIRHARDEVSRSLSRERFAASRDLSMAAANNAMTLALRGKLLATVGGGADPFVAAIQAKLDATREEVLSLYWQEQAWWQFRAQTIYFIDELPADIREHFDQQMRVVYRDPQSWPRIWFELQKPTLLPKVVRYIEELIAEPR